ncbi:MAG: glycosyltransferase family 4 protein [Anaerolineae bacterium]|nr:glycosyltransferase family 4 protein [Anaerolineae bacterium]MDQ7036655.1 glycosyltransferase family 4 protein [Anaerolineae bacterium]
MTDKLFIASGIFHPESGGPATYLYELLPALQQRNWSVDVLTYGDAPTVDYPYPIKRIPRRILPLRLLDYWRHARPCIAQADLIYAHTLDLPLSAGTAPRLIKIVGDAAWERSIRRAWIPATTDIDSFQTQDYGWLAQRQKQSRSRQVKAFDGVIVPSQYLKQMVCQWGMPEKHVTVIYNALPPLPAPMPESQLAAREALKWGAYPTLLTAARLNPWKGIDHLIHAIEKISDVRLIIAGDGSDRIRLEQIAQPLGDRVQFMGHVSRERLYQMMQAADYFALYSGYEGLPHTALEALRVGTPVIASDKGGNPEVIRHKENGFLVPYVDVDALTDTLKMAFASDTRDRLAAQTAHGMEQFTFDFMVSQTDKTLRQYLPSNA